MNFKHLDIFDTLYPIWKALVEAKIHLFEKRYLIELPNP
jgi:hypothetical protein